MFWLFQQNSIGYDIKTNTEGINEKGLLIIEDIINGKRESTPPVTNEKRKTEIKWQNGKANEIIEQNGRTKWWNEFQKQNGEIKW